MRNLGLESKTETLNCAEVTDILESSIIDILFEDAATEDDLCTFPLFETNDVMNSKVNAMKSDFSYLFNVFSNGSVHCIDQNTCIFDIYSISTEPFNIGIKNEPCILYILKDITPEEKREINKIFKDIINSAKRKRPPLPDTITEANINELMKNLGLESKTKNLNYDEVATILESSIDDILFEDTTEDDLCTLSLFEIDDVMNSKVNAMK